MKFAPKENVFFLINWLSRNFVIHLSYESVNLISFDGIPSTFEKDVREVFNFRGRVAWVTPLLMFSAPFHTLCTRLTRHISFSWSLSILFCDYILQHLFIFNHDFIPRPILCFNIFFVSSYKHIKANQASQREKNVMLHDVNLQAMKMFLATLIRVFN